MPSSARGYSAPGKPLPPIINRYVQIVGTRRYMNVDTGRTTSEHGYRNSLAQSSGFRNYDQYLGFRRIMPSLDPGSLGKMHPSDVRRAFSWFQDNPSTFHRAEPLVSSWLTTGPGRAKAMTLNRLLDALGLRDFTPGYLPGETLKKARRR